MFDMLREEAMRRDKPVVEIIREAIEKQYPEESARRRRMSLASDEGATDFGNDDQFDDFDLDDDE